MTAYCAVNRTPWFCRNFPHFFKITPSFWRFFTVILIHS